MSRPRLVLLDEPTAGVNPVLVETMERHIRDRHAAGVTFLDRRARHDVRDAAVRPGHRARRRPARCSPGRRPRCSAIRSCSTRTWGPDWAPCCASTAWSPGTAPATSSRASTSPSKPGTVICLIGPNGAGKSTVLKTVSGLLRPRVGSSSTAENDISRPAPEGAAAARHRARAAGAQPVSGDDRLGQPADGRLPDPRRQAAAAPAGRGGRRVPDLPRRGRGRTPARCPAASRSRSSWPAR